MAAPKNANKDLEAKAYEAVMKKIRADLVEYRPGLWAEKVGYGPACICGLRSEDQCHRHQAKEAA